MVLLLLLAKGLHKVFYSFLFLCRYQIVCLFQSISSPSFLNRLSFSLLLPASAPVYINSTITYHSTYFVFVLCVRDVEYFFLLIDA